MRTYLASTRKMIPNDVASHTKPPHSGGDARNREGITISNLNDGETLAHSLALIRGYGPKGCDRITIRGPTRNDVTEWPIVDGEFGSLVDLCRGENFLELEAGEAKRTLVLRHQPRQGRARVTPVYVICAGHDGRFQAPVGEDSSVESAAARIGLGARLLQTLTAEKLREAGHGRKTFQLERDLDGAECLVMRSGLDVDEARASPQRDLWELIARELMTGPLASKDRKYLAFLSCTRYRGAPRPRTHEDVLARTEAHAALGGGGLALFGTGCLYAWPESLRQVVSRFTDATLVDAERFMDDSNYRGTYGGCFATTLGSVLHELGHTFDLGHTRDGIMGRGFDHVDRVFLAGGCGIAAAAPEGTDSNRNPIQRDPRHATVALSRSLSVTVTVQRSPANDRNDGGSTRTGRGRYLSESTSRSSSALRSSLGSSASPGRLASAPVSPERDGSRAKLVSAAERVARNTADETFWGNSCAAILAYHRWFNYEMDNNTSINGTSAVMRYDAKRNAVRSRHGVRVIELRESSGEMVVCSKVFPASRPTVEAFVPLPPPTHRFVPLTLVAEDTVGNLLRQPIPTAF